MKLVEKLSKDMAMFYFYLSWLPFKITENHPRVRVGSKQETLNKSTGSECVKIKRI